MGMAASQVRLLALTSRLHDVEFEAQSLQNQKIALATQKDALYQNYCDALDAKKIQVAYMDGLGEYNYVDASFATLCEYNPNRVTEYALIDSRTDKVIVNQETYDTYQQYSNDKYSFAWVMLGFQAEAFAWEGTDNGNFPGAEIGYDNNASSETIAMTSVEQTVYNEFADEDSTLKAAYDNWVEVDGDSDATDKEKREALEKFRDALYANDKRRDKIFGYMRYSKQTASRDDENGQELTIEELANATIAKGDYNTNNPESYDDWGEFNYYVALFENIQAHGGCTPIDPACESGEEGETWFNNMVNAGLVLIEVYNDENEEWTQTSVATSSSGNFLKETQDETDLKKAEAEYEHELDKINDKDTKYDNQLNELETERTAITTEIESIQQVRDDNIERTFGIFS